MANVAELPLVPTPEEVRRLEMISPAMAHKWLEGMKAQRRIRRSRIEQLKRLAVTGKWKILPNAIIIDRDGKLIDGQHRLTVVIELDRPLPMWVHYNADPELRYSIDTSTAPKDLADALVMDGALVGYSTTLAVATRMLWRADQGRSALDVTLLPNNEEGIEAYRRHHDLLEAAKLAKRLSGIVPSQGLFCYYIYLAMRENMQRVYSFINRLATSENCQAGEPALLVRNTYMKDRANRVTRSPTDQAIIAATALNATLQGRKLYSWRNIEFGKGKIPAIEKWVPAKERRSH